MQKVVSTLNESAPSSKKQEKEMNIAPKLIYNVGILFLMMIPGVILKKCKFINDGFGKGISNLVLYIAQPALIFLAYLRPYDKNILINSLYVLAFSVVAHLIFWGVAMLFFRKTEDSKRRMLIFATIFSNAAFMGIPLISAVLGDEATLYASIYNITFNLFLWSLGVKICTEDRDIDGDGVDDADSIKKRGGGASLVKALKHPVTIAAFLGLVFFIAPIDTYVPGLITESLTMLKNLVAPLSMVVIGIRLADMDFRGFFKQKELYIFIGLRHFLLPALVFFVMKVCSLSGLVVANDVLLSVLIMASAPAATSATMFAEKYDCDAEYVSKLVAISTILSMASMPLVSMLVGI